MKETNAKITLQIELDVNYWSEEAKEKLLKRLESNYNSNNNSSGCFSSEGWDYKLSNKDAKIIKVEEIKKKKVTKSIKKDIIKTKKCKGCKL